MSQSSRAAPWLLVALAACAPDTAPAPRWWTVSDYAAGAKAGKRFGGFDPARLAVGDGAVPYRAPPYEPLEVRNDGALGVAVLPAFSAGRPAALAVTDIWQDHPTPWVQPVYVLVSEYDAASPGAKRLEGSWSLFPVDLHSGFYTPFWRVTYLEVGANPPQDALTHAGAALRVARSVHEGALVLCPIVPPDTTLAAGAGAEPVRPFTAEPVKGRTLRHAWVDGQEVSYLDFGRDLFTADATALVDEAPLYVFVAADGGQTRVLELPFVLDDQPFAQSLRRRYDVALSPSMAVFVPADRPALRDALRSAGLTVPEVSDLIPEELARAYTLRVAATAGCFAAPGEFPAGCRWLDSQAAIEALPRHTVTRTSVLVTAVTLRAGAEVLP